MALFSEQSKMESSSLILLLELATPTKTMKGRLILFILGILSIAGIFLLSNDTGHFDFVTDAPYVQNDVQTRISTDSSYVGSYSTAPASVQVSGGFTSPQIKIVQEFRQSSTAGPVTSVPQMANTTSTKKYSPNPRFAQCLKRDQNLWSNKPASLDHYNSMCARLLSAAISGKGNNQTEALFFNAASWKPPEPHSEQSILGLVNNCTRFLKTVSFATAPGSEEEQHFPLAYVFVAHRNAAQTVRLFRMLYQPQNAYCIAYDTKSEENYKQAVLAMASCFPSNVYITPEPEPIYYFGYSILRSVMKCLKVLLNSRIQWRYVQIVSWNDFPLKTNFEMVKIFQILNGSQDSELLKLDTPDYVTYRLGEHGSAHRAVPPGGITYYKGSFANSMTREFVNFTFSNPVAIRFYQSLEDSKCAEEFYWTTLIHNIQLGPPGGFPGQCELYYTNAGEKKPFLSRFQVWEGDTGDRKCKGMWFYLSCVYGVRDLGMLLKRKELIAHKLYEEFEPALSYCLEEWYWERVCSTKSRLDRTFFERLPSVRFHRLSSEDKNKFICALMQ